jgi:hypothetical protein
MDLYKYLNSMSGEGYIVSTQNKIKFTKRYFMWAYIPSTKFNRNLFCAVGETYGQMEGHDLSSFCARNTLSLHSNTQND